MGKFKPGTRVKLGKGAGLYEGQTGTVIPPRLHEGIPICVGSHAAFNRFTQVMVKLDGRGERTTVAYKKKLETVGETDRMYLGKVG